MTPAIYPSVDATDQVDHAQAEVDAHVTSGVDGRCQTCGERTPCPAYERALLVFAQSQYECSYGGR